MNRIKIFVILTYKFYIYLYLRLFTMKTKTLFDHIKQVTNVQNQLYWDEHYRRR